MLLELVSVRGQLYLLLGPLLQLLFCAKDVSYHILLLLYDRRHGVRGYFCQNTLSVCDCCLLDFDFFHETFAFVGLCLALVFQLLLDAELWIFALVTHQFRFQLVNFSLRRSDLSVQVYRSRDVLL